jgi:SMC interacting uncharacterized protein involved in chromosome segregation
MVAMGESVVDVVRVLFKFGSGNEEFVRHVLEGWIKLGEKEYLEWEKAKHLSPDEPTAIFEALARAINKDNERLKAENDRREATFEQFKRKVDKEKGS